MRDPTESCLDLTHTCPSRKTRESVRNPVRTGVLADRQSAWDLPFTEPDPTRRGTTPEEVRP